MLNGPVSCQLSLQQEFWGPKEGTGILTPLACEHWWPCGPASSLQELAMFPSPFSMARLTLSLPGTSP